MTTKIIFGSALILALVAGCGERDVQLPGERLDLRADLDASETDEAVFVNETRALALANAQVNADWTHRNGGPLHQIDHPALPAALSLAFSTNIGAGDSRRARITADPVVASGRIFAMDARAQVTATATDGSALWSRDITPGSDRNSDASGGGLAVDGSTLFVTSGFGTLTALDVQTGDELWTQDLNAPGGSAPTVSNGLVYVVARDSQAWAVDAQSGRIRWTMSGTPSVDGVSGGPGVAVTNGVAVIPFASGEVIGAFPEGGLRRWATVVAGQRQGRAAATITDLSGDPVVDGNIVYVGNFSGRLVAMNVDSGARIWTANDGAISPVWPAGDSVFVINDLNELVRLDAGDGSTIWRIALPQFEENRPGRQKTLHAHYGPVLAGGRLIVASSDGTLRQFDPTSGALLGQVDLPGGATTNPIVAGETLYVVNRRGQLLAFR